MHAICTQYIRDVRTRYARVTHAVPCALVGDLTSQRPLFVPIFFCAVPCAFYAVAAAAGGGSIDLARLQDDGYAACGMLHRTAERTPRQDKASICHCAHRIRVVIRASSACCARSCERTAPSAGLPPCATAGTGTAGGAAMLILLQLAAAAAAAGALLSHLDQL